MFFNKLDVAQAGAFGHSQGAGRAVKAMIKSSGSIKTVVPIELPSQIWCIANCADTRDVTLGSIFFVDGSLEL